MSEAKPNGTAPTNQNKLSVARVHHSEPTIELMGRKAGGALGNVGLIGHWGKPDLHFTVVVSDLYTGVFAMDGQPTGDVYLHANKPFELLAFLQSNFYRDTLPENVLVRIPIAPLDGMGASTFARDLIIHAHNFASYTADYSAPKWLIGKVMNDGEYNSSSYVAGLLRSVLGAVPRIDAPGYQTPGWENPLPASYFKGEAIR